MKAIVYSNYGGPEVLKLKDIETPKPKPNEVLVKVEAISLNPVDAKARRGGFRPMSDLLKFPRVTGTDFSGVIIETGKNVSGFKVGDSVYGWANPLINNGSAAEMLTISEKSIVTPPLSEQLPDLILLCMHISIHFDESLLLKG